MPNIRKFLDLSANHLPKEVFSDLNGFEGVLAFKLNIGALVWVPADIDVHLAEFEVFSAKENYDLEEFDRIPESIVAAWRHARSLDCDYVLFDQDAPVDHTLPRWDW